MSRTTILLFTLSFLQVILSVSLSAQYSHFPLSHLEINGIESEKFTESLAVNSFEKTPDIVKLPSLDSQRTTTTLTESSIGNGISSWHNQSLELSNVNLGISQDIIVKSDLDLEYINDLPATPRIDFSGSSTFSVTLFSSSKTCLRMIIITLKKTGYTIHLTSKIVPLLMKSCSN